MGQIIFEDWWKNALESQAFKKIPKMQNGAFVPVFIARAAWDACAHLIQQYPGLEFKTQKTGEGYPNSN